MQLMRPHGKFYAVTYNNHTYNLLFLLWKLKVIHSLLDARSVRLVDNCSTIVTSYGEDP